jgi:hypothetical protein
MESFAQMQLAGEFAKFPILPWPFPHLFMLWSCSEGRFCLRLLMLDCTHLQALLHPPEATSTACSSA